MECRGATICESLGFQPKVEFPLYKNVAERQFVVFAIRRASVSVARFHFKDPQNVAPRRVILGIRSLGWKPKAIKKSASSTSLFAKAVNDYLFENRRKSEDESRIGRLLSTHVCTGELNTDFTF